MYWACARIEVRREALAVHCLGLNGYETYLPRVRAQRRAPGGRKIEVRPPLFPGYLFFAVATGWHTARWTAGVLGLIMDGERPARVSDAIINEIRSREVRGLVELPARLKRGDPVRILHGPFREQLALYQEQAPHERVAVLLALFGSERRLTLRAGDVEAI